MSSQDQDMSARSCPVADSVNVSSQDQDVAARSCPVANNVSSQDQDVLPEVVLSLTTCPVKIRTWLSPTSGPLQPGNATPTLGMMELLMVDAWDSRDCQ